jgi:hypothetical protein
MLARKRKGVMKLTARLLLLIMVLVTGLSAPLGAQLEEARRVPWPGFQVLKGRWQALDDNIILDIKNIDPTGRMEVTYFKSEPVYVARAQAARDGKATKVLIQLRYPNSPCCIYDLTYDPGSERLKGIYWLKGNTKSTDVVFVRVK